MERKRARGWRYGVSRFLDKDYDFRPDIDSSTYTLSPTDVLLCPFEEDSLERAQRKAKRRRIYKLSRAFLAGEPLIVPSASLRGPFGRHTDVDHPHPEQDVVFQKARNATEVCPLSPGPTDHGLDMRYGLIAQRTEAHEVVDDSTVHDNEDVELRRGIAAAKRLSLTAVEVADAKMRAIAAEPSPFIYRRGKLPSRRLALDQAIHLRQGNDQDDSPSTSLRLSHTVENLAFPNARLSRMSRHSESPGSVRRRVHAAMEASGASFERARQRSQSVIDRSPLRATTANSSTSRPGRMLGNVHKVHDDAHIGGTAAADIPISTQVALREAHLDLLNDSPVKGLVSPDRRSILSRSKDQSESPVPAVTPFARIHSRFKDAHLATQENQLSTQNMLDGFSPFQISPVKPSQSTGPSKNLTNQTRGLPFENSQAISQTPQRAFADAWNFAGLPSASKQSQKATSKPTTGSQRSSHKGSLPSKVITGSQPKASPGLTSLGFKISKPHSISNTADANSSQGSKKTSTQTGTGVHDRNRSVNRSRSFNLAEILEDLSSGSSGDDKIGHEVLRSPHCSADRVFTPRSRGKVVDWDADEVEGSKEDNTSCSRVQDSFAPPVPTTHVDPVLEPVKSSGWVCINAASLSQFSPRQPLSGYESSAPVLTGRSSLKSALRKTQKSSVQDAQREPGLEDEMDLDSSLNDLRRSVLGSWDVDTALRGDAVSN